MAKKCLMTTVALAILSGLALAQVAGDYRSVTNGNWGTAATWETYDGASWVPASSAPPATPPYANITIQAGDTVIVEASPKRAASLKVEGTAKLYNNNTTNRYIRLWGNVTNDGYVGGPTDGLCYMCSTDVFMTGMGTTDIARLQVAAANVNIIIDRPISLHYKGAALYGNNVDNVTYNVGVNGEVNFGDSSYVGITTSSSLPSPYSATFNLAGGSFKLQPGMNFNMSVRSGKRAVLNLYSGLTLGDTLFAYSDSAGTEVVNIHENGGIIFSGMFTDTIRIDSLNINSNAGFSTPCPIVIKGGLGLQNGVCYNFPTFRMEKNSTIDRALGALANKPVFTDTINVVYSGAIPCTTGYELPYQSDDAVANLTVYHELYLDSTRYVNNVEAYGGPIIANEGDVLGVFGGYGMNEADGYVIGYMGRPVPVWGGTQQVAFMVGTANGSSPATLSFTGVTKAGLIACRAIDGVHPAAKVPQEAMQRQWDFGWRPDSIADYSSASLKLYYRPEDFNTSFTEADDESTMVMGMVGEDDSTWSFPLVANRIFNGTADGGMIEADEVGPFNAKFTMAKSKTSLTGDVEPPTIVSTLPADGATGVAVDAPIYIVFSEPIDYNSFYWSITPDPSLTETWNATFDTVSLAPISGNLDPSTLYTFRVTGASDLAGNPLAVLPDSFMFTTASGDTISPFVAFVSPAWEATDVGLNEPIIIVFSEPMDTNALVGFTDPFHDFTPAWSTSCDTFTLTPQYSYSPNSTMAVVVTAGTDLAGNSLAVLPDTIVKFTTIGKLGPVITMVEQPGDTYDGTGPFLVRAAITDPGKAGIVADTLWYTDCHLATWWAVTHSTIEGDTFSYSIPGPFAPGTVIEYFLGAWNDGGSAGYDPDMYRGYQLRILDPLPPSSLAAMASNMEVELTWAPPAEIIDYSTGNGTGLFLAAGDITDTRFTPQHYPCKLEQVVSSWWHAAGGDSVEVHVWPDDGSGLPDRSIDLVAPRVVMPLDYPNYTVVDLSSDSLVLSAGDFHVGYVLRTDNRPMPLCDGDGPGIHSTVYDFSADNWGMVWNVDDYNDWAQQAVVSYSSYSKGLKLKSCALEPGNKPLAKLSGLKTLPVANKQAPVYPELKGALLLAKNISGYSVWRSFDLGGPYMSLGTAGAPHYIDNTVTNGTPYYYVVRAHYSTPDTFSAYSNEASATPTGLGGGIVPGLYTLQLKPVAPNPVSGGKASFRFSLPAAGQVSLEIYNVLGQKVVTLVNGRMEAGNHVYDWNGGDANGRKLSSGVYIYQLKAMGRTLTRRLTVIR